MLLFGIEKDKWGSDKANTDIKTEIKE